MSNATSTGSARPEESQAGRPLGDQWIWERLNEYQNQQTRLHIDRDYPKQDENQRDAFRHGFTSGAVFGPMEKRLGEILTTAFVDFFNKISEDWYMSKKEILENRPEFYKTSHENDKYNNFRGLKYYRDLKNLLGREPTSDEFGDYIKDKVKAKELKFQRDDDVKPLGKRTSPLTKEQKKLSRKDLERVGHDNSSVRTMSDIDKDYLERPRPGMDRDKTMRA